MLDPMAIEYALCEFMRDVDYDIHKGLCSDEMDGFNHYPRLVREFILNYNSVTD